MMKDKKDKGFTLIELLAVIVILAIIALIAIPIVLNIINSANESSKIRSKELYLKAVDEAIARKNLTSNFNPSECTVNSDGNITCDEIELVIEVKGEKPCSGTITYENGKRLSESVAYCSGNNTSEEVKDPVSFETDDWGTIVGNIRKGNTDKYTVGTTRQVDLGSLGVHTLRIANTTTPDECSTQGFSQTACGFVIEFADIITTYKMKASNTNVGGWNDSALHRYLTSTIYGALPQELRDVIIDTFVVSGHGNKIGEKNFILKNEKLYLLSPHEVWENGSSNTITNDSAWNNTRQLDYYSNLNVTTDNYSDAKKYLSGTATRWWLRSACSDDNRFFLIVSSNGAKSTISGLEANSGVSPAFRLG